MRLTRVAHSRPWREQSQLGFVRTLPKGTGAARAAIGEMALPIEAERVAVLKQCRKLTANAKVDDREIEQARELRGKLRAVA